MRPAWWMTLLLGGSLSTAQLAWQEGRYEDAWKAFDAAVQERGEDAPAELLFNRAMAALQAGHLPEAEASAEQAAARGGPPFEGRRSFLLAAADLARADRIAARAAQPGGDPALYTAAITLAVEARAHWIESCPGDTDWPPALRNLERTQLRIRLWEELRAEAQPDRQPQPPPPQEPPDQEPPDQSEQPPEVAENLPAQEEPGPLTAEEIQRLRDQLRQKEQEKLMRRRARRTAATSTVEKDW